VALFVKEGAQSKILGLYPEEDFPESGLSTAANTAYRDQYAVVRVGQPGGGSNSHVSVYVAFTLRFLDRPAAVALALRVPSDVSDEKIIDDVVPLILRRADDESALRAQIEAAIKATPITSAVSQTVVSKSRSIDVESKAETRPSSESAIEIDAALDANTSTGEFASRIDDASTGFGEKDAPDSSGELVDSRPGDVPRNRRTYDRREQAWSEDHPDLTVLPILGESLPKTERTCDLAATAVCDSESMYLPESPGRNEPRFDSHEHEKQSLAEAELEVAQGAKSLHAGETEGAVADDVPEQVTIVAEQSAIIRSLATVLDHRDFSQSLHAFANGIAQTWHCLRVTIGLARSKRIVVETVSGVVDFDARSALMIDIGQALDETVAAASMILVPAETDMDAPPQAHVALAAQLKNPALLSVPLIDNDEVFGAILLERDRPFTGKEQLQLQRMALLLGPVIALKKLAAISPLAWSRRFLRRQLAALLGSSGLSLKIVALAVGVFALWSSFYTQDFRVDSRAEIEASVHRAVVANIPSFLKQVESKAGDVVHEGEILARLDVEDLELERVKWIGERDKLTREYRASMAQRDRSNVRVLEARRTQAESQIELLEAQIERATLRAPIDGVVVSGDLSQVLGSPVERGQLLFEVAALDDYRLVLMVDETDIGWVNPGQSGTLRLRSFPGESFAFSVASITPVSEAAGGANRFRVEATLSDSPASLRPGMEGVAKIDIEPRATAWIWTHSFVNWLRFELWKYGW